jgi:hypothetical protein
MHAERRLTSLGIVVAISSLDTLDIAKRLKQAGFSDAQAEAVTTVFRDVRTADLANLATKADIERIEADIERLETATKAEFQRLDAKMESQLQLLRRDLTIRLGSMIVVGTGILLAAKFFG